MGAAKQRPATTGSLERPGPYPAAALRDLATLETFLVLADELHFGRTAARLHLSTASVSQRIARLERQLGGSLASRTTRRMQLTELGESLRSEAIALLDQFDATERRLRAQAAGTAGRLHLSFIGSVGTLILPSLVRTATSQIPDLMIEIGGQAFTTQIENLLDTRRTDVGILRTPVRTPGLAWRVLYDDPLSIVLPATHPLATGRRVTLAELRNETHVMFRQHAGSVVAEQAISMYREAGYIPQRRIEVAETATVIGLVGLGLGVAIMPRSTERLGIKGARFFEVERAARTQVVLAWRSDDDNPLRERFVNVLDAAGRFVDSPPAKS